VPDEETNQLTAFHEAGHTLVAMYTKDATALNKVTIIPRGGSLGHVSLVSHYSLQLHLMYELNLVFCAEDKHGDYIPFSVLPFVCIIACYSRGSQYNAIFF